MPTSSHPTLSTSVLPTTALCQGLLLSLLCCLDPRIRTAYPQHSWSWLLFQVCSMHLPLAAGLFSMKGLFSLEGLTPSHTLYTTSQNQHRISAHLAPGCMPMSFSFLPLGCMYKQNTHTCACVTKFYGFFPYSFSSLLNHPLYSYCHCTQWVSNYSVHSRSTRVLVIKPDSLTMPDGGKDFWSRIPHRWWEWKLVLPGKTGRLC